MEWLFNIIYYVVPFIVLLGILVFVHEFGHFIVARLLGVSVTDFSIGFGKELYGFADKKGTRWKICAIPLGGYCQFLGDAEASSTSSDNSISLSKEEQKQAFSFQNPWKKMAIVIGGPAFNYIFAILVFTILFASLGKIEFPPVVGEVIKDGPAYNAGIIAQDKILEVNGKKVATFGDITKEIMLTANPIAEVKLQRGGEVIDLSIELKEMEVDEKGQVNKRPMLGVKSLNTTEVTHQPMSVPAAFVEASVETWDITASTLKGVGQMITGKRGADDLGGIIRIAEMTGDITKTNRWLDFFVFMALLSINLGLINLFPIPVLDGGHIVIYLTEIITRKPINEKLKENLFKGGFAIIIALMIFATWNDFVHLFNRWFA